ncbi:MAG: glycerophosphodiester phosphodiesterase [Limisphaerales bacterium]
MKIATECLLGFLVLACSAALCRAVDLPFYQPVRPPRPFQFMVHQGESRQAPGNSRPALLRCIEDNLEWAEVDLRLTKDGQHVLSHGDSVAGQNNEAWRISEHTLAELQTLDIGSPFAARFHDERLLSLKEAFDLCKGKLNLCLNCETVHPEQLVGEILAAGMETQVVVYGELDNLRRVREAAHGKVALMAAWRTDFGRAEWAVKNGLRAVEIDAPDITPGVCTSFHQEGIYVEAKVLGQWDQPESWSKAAAAGVDWMQTDVPEELMAHSLWQRIKRRPVLFSLHRGANRYAPENTLPAFDKGIRLGADYIEFDVRTTSDGKFYLLHDSTLDGRTDGKGRIADTSASVVSGLSAGVKFARTYAKTPLPTLDEFLNDVAGKVGLYFDAKDIAPARLADALERYGVLDRTVVYGGPQFLARVKAVNPRIRLLPPLGSPGAIDALARELQPYAFDTKWEILSPELIARCHELGIKVFSDSLGNHEHIEDFQKAMDWGIDLIQTDHPLRLFRAIELRASHEADVLPPPIVGASRENQ